MIRNDDDSKGTRKSIIPMNLEMNLVDQFDKPVTWTSYFEVDTTLPRRMKAMHQLGRGQQVGVCLSLPYRTSDIDKINVNGALLHEWVRYYTKLGMTIFIYDRDGNHFPYISDLTGKNLVYHNYTIRGLLEPDAKFYFDNSESELGGVHAPNYRYHRWEAQGHDKSNTLTHCRFAAKSSYGIEDIIVADFDEFLYCPAGGPTAKGQRNMIHELLDSYRSNGIEQITIPQRILANKTESVRECMIDLIANNL